MKLKFKKTWEHCTIEPYRTINYHAFKNNDTSKIQNCLTSTTIKHHKGNKIYVASHGNLLKSFDTFKGAKFFLESIV